MLKKNENIVQKDTPETLEALRQGSAEAYQILYKKYNQKIYRFCLRMLLDADLARDAFQETFIKVYEHRRDFKGNNFSAWLYTIARRTCLNAIRTRKESESYDEFVHYSIKDNREDVAMKDCIDKALAVLPIALREAILLRVYEDCSYQEMTEISGIDLSLAKIRVFRAREILRKLLAPLKQELYES